MGKVIVQSHIPSVPYCPGVAFLSYDFFKIWPWKSRVNGWGHSSKSHCGSNILSTRIPFVPCQSALPFLRYSIFKIWPWKYRAMVIQPLCCTNTGPDNSIELWPTQRFQRYGSRKVWPKCCPIWQVFGPWTSPYVANGQITMALHNFRSRQVHETLNGVNPSNGFRDMRSAKSGPNLWQIWQVFWPMGKPIWGKWANDHDSAQQQA